MSKLNPVKALEGTVNTGNLTIVNTGPRVTLRSAPGALSGAIEGAAAPLILEGAKDGKPTSTPVDGAAWNAAREHAVSGPVLRRLVDARTLIVAA